MERLGTNGPGFTIDEEEDIRLDLPYFGNVPGEVEVDCWRIGCGNINRLSVGGMLHKDNGALFQDIINHNLDVVKLQELGLNWNEVNFKERFQGRLDHWMEPGQTKSVVGWDRRMLCKENYNGVALEYWLIER